MIVNKIVLRKLTLTGVAFAALAIVPSNGFATALPVGDGGILQIGNVAGALVGVTTVPPTICWAGGLGCTAGTARPMAVSGSSADFSTTVSPTDTIKDLGGFGPVIAFETVLGGTGVSGATVNFDLTSFVLPNAGAGFGNCGSNAANNSCAPANSPFTFSEDSSGSQLTIGFTTLLEGYTGSSGTAYNAATAYRGIFTTQLSGTLTTLNASGSCVGAAASITGILGCEGTGGTVDATWSATESPIPNPGTPEPLSFVLFGSGLVGLALLRRHRRSS